MQAFSKKTISTAEQITVDSRDPEGEGAVAEVVNAYAEGNAEPFLVVMVKGEKSGRSIEFDVMIQRDGKQFAARVRHGGPGSLDWKNITRKVGRGGEWAVKTHFRSVREAVEHAVCNPHFNG